MVIRVPDSVVADRYTAGQQGKQDFYRNQMMQRQMLTGIGQDLNAVADYTQDKYLLEQLAAQQPPQVRQPQSPQLQPEQIEQFSKIMADEYGFDTPEKVDKLANDFKAISVSPQSALPIMIERINEGEANGQDMTQSRELLQQLQVNPQGALQEIQTINQLISDPKIRAYMARNPARAAQTMGMMGVQNDAAIAAQQAAASAKILESQEKENQEIWKELL
jgi:hypothetical protein